MLLGSFRLVGPAAPTGWVVGWGDNVSGGATGVPIVGYTNGLVTINGRILTNAVAVSAGKAHGLAIRSDTTVVGWGLNNQGQAIGIPSPGHTNGLVEIDGQILSNAVAVAAGGGSSLVLKSDGTVVCWGTQMGVSKTRLGILQSNTVSIANGFVGAVVKSDGTVVSLQGDQYKSLNNIVALAISPGTGSGGNTIQLIALKRDGTAVELALGTSNPPVSVAASNVVAIAAGGQQRLALRGDATVYEWGRPDSPPPGLSHVTAIATGRFHSMALKSDGTVMTWGFPMPHVLDTPEGLSNVVAIAAGADFCLAITTNRAVAEKFRH